MSDFKHLVVVKFKEDAVVDEILKGLEKLAMEMDAVKSFEWGQDMEGPNMLRQGFSHSFLMTFNNKEDFNAFAAHPKHVDFSAKFSGVVDKVILLDFQTVAVKKSD